MIFLPIFDRAKGMRKRKKSFTHSSPHFRKLQNTVLNFGIASVHESNNIYLHMTDI